MSDPKKFKPHYVIEAFSKKKNKIREQHLTTEMGRMEKPGSLIAAKKRCFEFAKSLNEKSALGVDDWKPMLHLQYTETNKLLVSLE